MKALLDTHALLWWLEDNPTLSGRARDCISNGLNLIHVSAAAIWEIRIKQALGKLEIPSDFTQVLNRQLFEMLPITVEHADAVGNLPTLHRDPFDRMLIAQARVENLTIITRDSIFHQYQVPIVKA